MKLILLIFLPLHIFAQSIAFHDGAGINPRHIESIGNDAGWVEVCPGPMPTDGKIFSIKLDDLCRIDTVFVRVYDSEGLTKYTLKYHCVAGSDEFFAPIGFKGCIRLEYTVKRKNV